MELVNEAPCQGQGLLPTLCRALDDLVVNVCEVAHVLHVVLQLPQQAVQDVKRDIHTRVTCVVLCARKQQWGEGGETPKRGRQGLGD